MKSVGDQYTVKIVEGIAGPSSEVESTGRRLYEAVRSGVVQVYTDRGCGSGFVANSDGRIITDAHVVGGASEIFVVDKNQAWHKAGIEKLDDIHDLAVLKVVEGSGNLSTVLQFRQTSGTRAELRAGDKLFGIGHGDGVETPELTIGYFKQRMTQLDYWKSNSPKAESIVNSHMSRLSPDERRDMAEVKSKSVIQAKMLGVPGDSGAPVLDANGEVIGVITGGLSDITAMTPAEQARKILFEPGRFKVEHGLRSEKWAERFKTMVADDPLAAVSLSGMAGVAAYNSAMIGRTYPRLIGTGVAAFGYLNLLEDNFYLQRATDSMGRLKYGAAASGDFLQTVGGLCMLIPRVRTMGTLAACLGLGTKLGSDFIPNHYVVKRISRLDGSSNEPFSWRRDQ